MLTPTSKVDSGGHKPTASNFTIMKQVWLFNKGTQHYMNTQPCLALAAPKVEA